MICAYMTSRAGKPHFAKEEPMNRDQMQGNWMQMKGKVKEKWGKLTNDDLDVVNGKIEQLAGKIQERYGIAREEADRQVKEWLEHEQFDTPRR